MEDNFYFEDCMVSLLFDEINVGSRVIVKQSRAENLTIFISRVVMPAPA